MRCNWCNTDADEAAALHEGPHATWCVHWRAPPLPEGLTAEVGKDGQKVYRYTPPRSDGARV